MRFKKYILEAKGKKLTRPVIKKINKEISKIMKRIYFKSIPLKDIFDVLERYGIKVVQEDYTPWSGLLTGGVDDTEQVYFDLAWDEPDDRGMYTSIIPDSKLALSYYKMQSGKYEVIAYLT